MADFFALLPRTTRQAAAQLSAAPEQVTSDFVYVRLHGDVFVYLDNDAKGRAPHDAVALLERLR